VTSRNTLQSGITSFKTLQTNPNAINLYFPSSQGEEDLNLLNAFSKIGTHTIYYCGLRISDCGIMDLEAKEFRNYEFLIPQFPNFSIPQFLNSLIPQSPIPQSDNNLGIVSLNSES
jgi:hypothetical protein